MGDHSLAREDASLPRLARRKRRNGARCLLLPVHMAFRGVETRKMARREDNATRERSSILKQNERMASGAVESAHTL